MQLRRATRKQVKLKIALTGPSGSGKTYSALLLAFGLTGEWSKVAIIDTENRSADLYADLGEYNVLPLSAPYAPERYIEALRFCASQPDIEVIIIDSMSHEWAGQGGILEEKDQAPGTNSFAAWKTLTPRDNAFVAEILSTDKHIIGTLRVKQDYVLEANDRGKQVPKKVGMKPIIREGMDYEFGLVFDVDTAHQALATKDRTGLFSGKPARLLDSDAGQLLRDWAATGVDEVAAAVVEMEAVESRADSVKVWQKYPHLQSSTAFKAAAATIGAKYPKELIAAE